jgi:TolA-binding protein
MKTENKPIKNFKQKVAGGIILKLVFVMLSFVQAYWVPIAWAAGTVAAAAMFGDKAYWVNIGKDVKKIVDEKKPQDVVAFIEAEIVKYSKWRQGNTDKALYTDLRINDLYFNLAKAKEAAGLEKKEVIDAYKRAVASPSYGGEALAWLCKNTPNAEHQDVFKQIFKEVTENKQGLQKIVQQVENAGDWSAFEFFLAAVFEQIPEPVSTAKIIEISLKKDGKDGKWNDKFIEYCRRSPKVIEYIYEKDSKAAEELVKKEEFKKAVSAYRDMAERYKNLTEKKTDVEFKICQCLFNGGDYNAAISEINSFLERNKTTSRILAKDAFLLRGQCHIQLGEVDKASNEFLTLIIEYPETKQAPEANFFIGYCYMLQSKFDQAKEALNLVVKDYPQSSFASKAKLCLIRIESMAEKSK